MKKATKLIPGITLFTILVSFLYANPVMQHIITEFIPDHEDPQNWKLELYNYMEEDALNLTGHFITAGEDTAYFSDSFTIEPGAYRVITNDDLEPDIVLSFSLTNPGTAN